MVILPSVTRFTRLVYAAPEVRACISHGPMNPAPHLHVVVDANKLEKVQVMSFWEGLLHPSSSN